jgi:arylformamidase
MLGSDDAAAGFERQYTPELSVTNFEQKFNERAERSEATRSRWSCQLDIRFGPGPNETLDVFPAQKPAAPVQVFFHGGYWRRGDKDSCSFLAEPFLEHGAWSCFPTTIYAPT